MADGETDDSGNAPDATVTVEVNAEDSAPAEEPTVIVVNNEDSGEDSGHSEEELDRWVQLEARLSGIEQRINEAQTTAWEAADAAAEASKEAEVAEAVAVADAMAIEEVSEEVEETSETVEDAIAPASTNVHPVFRPFRDWFPKRES